MKSALNRLPRADVPAGSSAASIRAPAVLATILLVHALACAIAAASSALLAACRIAPFSPFEFALLEGLVALTGGRALGLAAWWQPINLGFPLAACGLLALDLAPAWYLAAFIALFAIFGATCRTRVPLYLTSARAVEALSGLVPAQMPLRFLDAGCGTGTVLAAMSRMRPAAQMTGIEAALAPWLISFLRSAFSGGRFSVRWGDFWALDFSQYDIVYVFLSPAAMPALWRKARHEMRTGSVLVSNSFIVPGVAPAMMLAVQGGAPLYVWRM